MISQEIVTILENEFDNYLLSDKIIVTKGGRALVRYQFPFMNGEFTMLEQNPEPGKKFAHLCEVGKHNVCQVYYRDATTFGSSYGKNLCVMKDGKVIEKY